MKNRFLIGKKVLDVFLSNGHLAYFVGGFVRDFLMGCESDDIDITTSALPDETLKLFEKAVPTGVKYGTVTVWMDEVAFEVTTFRSDGISINHRHPEAVQYSKKLEDDLVRRDFTINALAMDIEEHIYDFHHGKEDLSNKLIRAVGKPEDRFIEDSLRILRAFRFVSKTNFDIEEDTKNAIKNNRMLLQTLANERVIIELDKILRYPYQKKAFQLMEETNLFDAFPELKVGALSYTHQEQILQSGKMFLTLCFYFNEGVIPDNWRFSNKDKNQMQQIINLMIVTQEDQFQLEHIYSLKREICLLANSLNLIINPLNDQSNHILAIDEDLVIRRTCDLTFKGGDILELTSLDDASIIGDIIDDLINKVLHKELKNEYNELKKYTFKTYFKE